MNRQIYVLTISTALLINILLYDSVSSGHGQANDDQVVQRSSDGQQDTGTSAPSGETGSQLQTELAVKSAQASPMMKEILAAVQNGRQVVRELNLRMQSVRDEETAIALIRRIEEARVNTQRRSLHIQIKYAQIEGRIAQAARLVTSLEKLDHPAESNHPQTKPRQPLIDAQEQNDGRGGR